MRPGIQHTQSEAATGTQRYIEHLETELEAAQAARDALPRLNAQLKRLQTEVAEWEARWEEREQEAAESKSGIEARVSRLEEELEGSRRHEEDLERELEYSRLREEELERNLDSAHQSNDAAEAGNIGLEKRLEIMSELLAASPTKLDLHIGPRHARQRSDVPLPRLPTAAALRSPQRQSFAAAAPLTSPQRRSFGFPFPPPSPASPPQPQHEPTRRMRRFGPGSMGPKPLILPSTSHHIPIPYSPLGSPDRHDSAYQSSTANSRSPPDNDNDEYESDDGSHESHNRLQTLHDDFLARSSSSSPRTRMLADSPDIETLTSRDRLSLASAQGSLYRATEATPKRNLMEELRDYQSPDFWSSSPSSSSSQQRSAAAHPQHSPRTPCPRDRRRSTASTPGTRRSSTRHRRGTFLSRIDGLAVYLSQHPLFKFQWWIVGTFFGVCAFGAIRLRLMSKYFGGEKTS